jgi:hypothetical protein
MGELGFVTVLVACALAGAFCWGLFVVRDIFHPVVFLTPMLAYIYVYLPWELYNSGLISSAIYNVREMGSVQWYNLACVVALLSGCILAGSRRPPDWREKARAARALNGLAAGDRAFRAALVFGCLGVLAYAVNLGNVGGIVDAYSVEKGGGTAESGYVRDAVMWCLTALALVYFRMSRGKIGNHQYAALICFAAPLVMHALLSGRRGPTFIIFSLLCVGWYLAHRKRPSVLLFAGGAAGLGMLLLLMLTFRDSFRIGSDLFSNPTNAIQNISSQFEERRAQQMQRSLSSNEFVYGVTVVKEFEQRQDYFWGQRLLGVLVIRPIPRQLWPTKYEDMGLGRYEVNAGLTLGDDTMGGVAYGAAPGFAADLFAEFSWLAVGVSFLAGYAYGASWRRCVMFGGIWLVLYLLMVSFSIFFAVQTMEAVLFRMAFTFIPALIVWRLYISNPNKEITLRQRPAARVGNSTA